MNTNPYSFLYYFQNEYMAVVEVKRDGLPSTATPDQVYAWLVINPKTQEYKKLSFKSMGAETINGNEIQVRTFLEGELRFDANFSKFVYGPNSHLLERSAPEKVTDIIKEITVKFLTAQS